MHFEGICGLKTELNYPFKSVVLTVSNCPTMLARASKYVGSWDNLSSPCLKTDKD